MHLRRVPFQDPLHLWDPYLTHRKDPSKEFPNKKITKVVNLFPRVTLQESNFLGVAHTVAIPSAMNGETPAARWFAVPDRSNNGHHGCGNNDSFAPAHRNH
jgi:hypothetical protein